MTVTSWRRAIGDAAFNYIVLGTSGVAHSDTYASQVQGVHAQQVAEILTRAFEMGWRAPMGNPGVSAEGTRVLWPSGAVLTARGLLRHWQIRGHGFLLLRVDQLLKAVAGPLLPRLQEMLTAYEAQCEVDRVAPLGEGADLRVFVGGEGVIGRGPLGRSVQGEGLIGHLLFVSPTPDPKAIKKATVKGPGDA